MCWLTETFISIVIKDMWMCVLESIHDTCTIQYVVIVAVFDLEQEGIICCRKSTEKSDQ